MSKNDRPKKEEDEEHNKIVIYATSWEVGLSFSPDEWCYKMREARSSFNQLRKLHFLYEW